MEELLKSKEEELAKLHQMKDVLKNKIQSISNENKQLSAERDKLKEELEASKIPPYPDLSSELEAIRQELETLQKAFNEKGQNLEEAKSNIENLENKIVEKETQILNREEIIEEKSRITNNLETELEELKEKYNQVNAEKEKLEKLFNSDDKELPIAVLLNQLKNGMFSLGMQNKSIETKLDEISSQMNLVEHVVEEKCVEPAPETKQKSPKTEIFTNIKPSMMHQEPKPSMLHSIKTEEASIPKVESIENPIHPLKKISEEEKIRTSNIPTILHGLITIPYPEDGAIKCPKCDKQEFKEQENKNKILSYAPIKKYGKKYYCKACRTEWDYET